ncbi:MAG: UDPGP type 1 family protein [Planctomycetota bacterium]
MTTTAADLDARLDSARAALQACGQAHVLRAWDDLDHDGRARLLDDIEGVDWPEVDRLIESHVKQKPVFAAPDNVEPAPVFPASPTADLEGRYAQAVKAGKTLLKQGKVAAFCVAGGQGTRLGWPGPKGTFPATPILGKPLFQTFAEQLQKAGRTYGKTPPFYVMTSPVNHADTLAFFEEHDYFGLSKTDVMLFPQAMMPAVDLQTHKVLRSAPDRLALSPNGHGGSLKALWTSGAIADMRKRGVEQVSYVQVDNPLVKVLDPLFLGLHTLGGAQMSSKALPKAHAMEKVGNFCKAGGKVRVIEYSNMPDELAQKTNADGSLMFNAGSIAIHTIAVSFVEQLNQKGFGLPWNRAEKKVPFVDDAGAEHSPDTPNAVKLETFVFDALPLCDESIVLETDRAEEFAPIKNADAAEGEPEQADSPASSKRMQSERAAAWLASAGVDIPRSADGGVDAVIELSPLTAAGPADLGRAELPESIEAGAAITL